MFDLNNQNPKIMKKNYLLVSLILISTLGFSQSVILIDDYDTPAPKYTSSGDYFDSSTQYFGTTNDTDADVELGYSDIPFFGARQLKSATESILYDNLDISGLSTVNLIIGVAEDKAADGFEDWDTGDYVHFEYQIDNSGTWNKFFSIVASGATDSAPQMDMNSDGTGDGVLITSDIEEVEAEITGLTGNLLDFRITFGGLSENEEDIAIEFIALINGIDLLPETTITSPTGGQTFANGTTSVNVNYTVTGNADSIEIIVNGGTPVAGSVSGGTFNVPTTNNQAYEVEIVGYLDGYNVDDTDVTFEVGNPLSVGNNEIENFTVFPNPISNGVFSISSSNNTLKNIQLYDCLLYTYDAADDVSTV